jgi:hypothetical protein
VELEGRKGRKFRQEKRKKCREQQKHRYGVVSVEKVLVARQGDQMCL